MFDTRKRLVPALVAAAVCLLPSLAAAQARVIASGLDNPRGLAFSPEGRHGRPFAEFVAPIEQTARFCGMNWLPPFAVHGAHAIPDEELAGTAAGFRARLESWRAGEPA